MSELTHFNASGEAHMVDVGRKDVTHRLALADGLIRMRPETLAMIASGGHKKGDVLGIARLAGIMAAKKTADLVPLCHPIPLTKVEIDLSIRSDQVAVYCVGRAETWGRTGVEMEALMAVQVSLLTVYDMCKAVDRGMAIDAVRLLKKSGGRSGAWERNPEA